VSTSSYGPVVSSVLLRQALKRLRQAAVQQQDQVAGSLGWPVSKLIRIENGNIPILGTDLEALLRLYQVTEPERVDELTAWARDVGVPGWWERFRIEDKAFERYIGYESGAASIRMAQGLLVPGILQTEDYARLVTRSYAAPEVTDTILLLRMERQREVFARAPQQYHILDEAVLRRPIGNVMPGQVQRLAELARQPEITIRVIPFEASPHPGLRGPFVLLGFDAPIGSILYLESARTPDENLLISEENIVSNRGVPAADAAEEIASYDDRFEILKRLALEPAESTGLLDQIASDLG
jgi:transcriptional regulator with XRE-family HTH domain